MRLVRTKFRKNIFYKILPTAKDYYFICPIKNVEVGDALLVEFNTKSYRKKYNGNFIGIVRVEEIIDKNAKEIVTQYKPTAFALMNLGKYEDIDKRLIKVTDIREKYVSDFGKYLNIKV